LKGFIEEVDRPKKGTKMRSVIEKLCDVDFLQGTNALIIVLNDAISRLLRIDPNRIMPLGLYPTKLILQTMSVETGNPAIVGNIISSGSIEEKGAREQSIANNVSSKDETATTVTTSAVTDEMNRKPPPTTSNQSESNQMRKFFNPEGSLPSISTLSAQYNPFMVGFLTGNKNEPFNISSNQQLTSRYMSPSSNFPIMPFTMANTIGDGTAMAKPPPPLPVSFANSNNQTIFNTRSNFNQTKTTEIDSTFQPPYAAYSNIVSKILNENRNQQRINTFEKVSSHEINPDFLIVIKLLKYSASRSSLCTRYPHTGKQFIIRTRYPQDKR